MTLYTDHRYKVIIIIYFISQKQVYWAPLRLSCDGGPEILVLDAYTLYIVHI